MRFLHMPKPGACLHLPRQLCTFLLGKEHKSSHRMVAGLIVMSVGVAIAKLGADVHEFGVHYMADAMGYAVHGMGALPFIEYLIGEE